MSTQRKTYAPGTYISWRTWCGRATAKVVSEHGLMASDGFTEFCERHPRDAALATDDEIAEFERIRAGRVAPSSYE